MIIRRKKGKNGITYKEKLKQVVDDFMPDIIHVFGSEQQLGLVSSVTEIPVLLHIQGLLNPIYNALLPPFFFME